MSFLLFIIATLFIIISYHISNKCLITPAVISSIVIAFSSIIGAAFEDRWNLYLHIETVLIIGGGLFFIIIGNWSALRIENLFSKRNSSNISGTKRKYRIDNIFFVLYLLFATVLVYQMYSNIDYYIMSLGTSYMESTDVLLQVREAKLAHDFDEPLGLKIATSINNCLFIVSCYCVIYNNTFFKLEREDIKFFFPIIIYTVTSILNASRIDFLGPFFYLISLYTMMLHYKFDHYVVLKEFITKVGGASIVFLSWFSLLRYFRGGSFDIFEHLARYISGGIFSFDNYIIGDTQPYLYSHDFGVYTLRNIYSVLENIGYYNDVAGRTSSDNWVILTQYHSNIFSAFAPMVEDFSVIGCWIILYMISFFMGLAQQYLVKNKIIGLKLIVYTETMSIFFMLPVAEQLFSSHLIMSRVAHFVLVYAFLSIFDKWRKRISN